MWRREGGELVLDGGGPRVRHVSDLELWSSLSRSLSHAPHRRMHGCFYVWWGLRVRLGVHVCVLITCIILALGCRGLVIAGPESGPLMAVVGQEYRLWR